MPTTAGRTRAPRLVSIVLLAAAMGTPACANDPGSPDLRVCGPYPDQASSPYALPYPVGAEFVVGQGNCTEVSHRYGTPFTYAYDFLMPIGSPVAAVRAGRVVLVQERFEDGDNEPGHENFVTVEHDDGTAAQYVHLTRNGALVEVGDRVRRGEMIALSGHTGASTEPHLHLNVMPCPGCETMPTVFRNTRPHPSGLQQGERYRADPWP